MKRILAMTLVLIFALALPAAAVLDFIDFDPSLSFSGGKAFCTLDIQGNNSDDEIEATVKLYYNNVVVGSWSDSGEGSLTVSGSCRANSGLTYTMKSTVYINGVRQSVSDITRTCP